MSFPYLNMVCRNFVNDSLSTTVCLQWEPEIIAVALIHLASKLSKFTVDDWTGRQPTHLRWWDMFISDVTMEILEGICHEVLDLYQQSNQQQSNDNIVQSSAAALGMKSSRSSPHVKGNSPQDKNISPPNNNSTQSQLLMPPMAKMTDKKDGVPLNVMPHANGGENFHYMYAPYGNYATAPHQMPSHPIMQPSIYPSNPYLQSSMMPPFNMQHPQCAQQPPHYNQPHSHRMSSEYFPGSLIEK